MMTTLSSREHPHIIERRQSFIAALRSNFLQMGGLEIDFDVTQDGSPLCSDQPEYWKNPQRHYGLFFSIHHKGNQTRMDLAFPRTPPGNPSSSNAIPTMTCAVKIKSRKNNDGTFQFSLAITHFEMGQLRVSAQKPWQFVPGNAIAKKAPFAAFTPSHYTKFCAIWRAFCWHHFKPFAEVWTQRVLLSLDPAQRNALVVKVTHESGERSENQLMVHCVSPIDFSIAQILPVLNRFFRLLGTRVLRGEFEKLLCDRFNAVRRDPTPAKIRPVEPSHPMLEKVPLQDKTLHDIFLLRREWVQLQNSHPTATRERYLESQSIVAARTRKGRLETVIPVAGEKSLPFFAGLLRSFHRNGFGTPAFNPKRPLSFTDQRVSSDGHFRFLHAALPLFGPFTENKNQVVFLFNLSIFSEATDEGLVADLTFEKAYVLQWNLAQQGVSNFRGKEFAEFLKESNLPNFDSGNFERLAMGFLQLQLKQWLAAEDFQDAGLRIEPGPFSQDVVGGPRNFSICAAENQAAIDRFLNRFCERFAVTQLNGDFFRFMQADPEKPRA